MFKSKGSPLLDLYAIWWHITRAYPEVKDAAGRPVNGKRPETFAAVGSIDDVEKSALGKGARYANPEQRLFYSRAWSSWGRAAGRQFQSGELKFNYPAIFFEQESFDPRIKEARNQLHFNLFFTDQHPGKVTYSSADSYANNRTFEELEADLTTIFQNTIHHFFNDWYAYELNGVVYWSPDNNPPNGARIVWKIRDGLVTDDLKGRFFRDFGSDEVSGIQCFCSVLLPKLICYTPEESRQALVFDYDVAEGVARPSGAPGGNEQETTVL